ncbi:General substrate transporter [Cordyceps fumosorosea ARSEF 2679]|uniref:General substrate transporter n=1 Tax=Cordyceps fumosorosea (strain ARSEF 2679) TaxID=1081104 RepID=A0A168B0T6_CORFA|nr:General substrate transporter [Cordyceps fumosorosea ARSEF 2679]OAA69457.1 General substrate transporter [Cordyceps fumosorosea ARSEF 2679]
MDDSQEPLISGEQHEDDVARGSDASPRKGPDQTGLGPFVLLLTLSAGISGLLFGYDTGVISATLVSIGTALSGRELTSLDKSIITSATSLFALLFSPLSSVLADRLGRRRVILLADALFVAGAALQAVSSSVTLMVAGRCVIGAGVGAASLVVPLYIAEVAPARYRGRLVTANVMLITAGQALAYVVGWLLATRAPPETGWRWMVGLGAAPAAVQAVLVALMPETPRWLVKAGRSATARRVVARTQAAGEEEDSADVDGIIKSIEVELRAEREARALRGARHSRMPRWLGDWAELLRVGQNRRALAIACLLQGLQQLSGFNSLMYFSATIFTMVGFRSPTLAALSVAMTNLIFTGVALVLIDRVGRRRILLYSIPLMVCGLLLASLGFSHLSLDASPRVSSSSSSLPSSSRDNVPPVEENTSAASTILFSIMLYVASYAVGLGNVPWMQSELFPTAVRSAGSGVATATNWSANFVVGLTFLPLMERLTPPWTFALYAGVCAAGEALIWLIYPETAGLSLEESTSLLEHGWGVR